MCPRSSGRSRRKFAEVREVGAVRLVEPHDEVEAPLALEHLRDRLALQGGLHELGDVLRGSRRRTRGRRAAAGCAARPRSRIGSIDGRSDARARPPIAALISFASFASVSRSSP